MSITIHTWKERAMTTPTVSELLISLEDNSSERQADHAAFLQERFSGALPQRNERPAADLFRERLAEMDADGIPALFIP
jgi:hypothetical protein